MALTMRVSAQADFAQLKREMRGLNNEFSSFKTNVARGFGQGFLSSSQSRTMEYAQKQMSNSIRTLNTLLDEQEDKVRQLNNVKILSNTQNKNVKDEIAARRKNIDTIQAEIGAIEDRQKALNEQTAGMKVMPDRNDKKASDNSAVGSIKSAASTLGGIVSKVLGIAGIAGIASFAGQAIDFSTERHKLAAVIGSRSGATTRGEYDAVLENSRNIGLPMGYNGLETMQQTDNFMKTGGKITGTDIEGLQKFARGKGEDIGGVISAFSEMKRFGSSQTGQQSQFADMIATSITQSGMQERSAEALQTLTGLVGDIAQSMPNVDASGIAAMQTILARTGEEALKGERGGDIISALNGIITSKNQNTEFAMLRAIGWGSGKSYYDSKMQAEEGATPKNVGALMGFVQGQGYDKETQDILLSSMSGGNISLQKARLLREKVGNNFSEENITAVQADINKGGTLDVEAGDYMKSYGAYINKTDAQLNESMSKIGDGLILVAYGIKDGFDRFLGVSNNTTQGVWGIAKEAVAGIAGVIGGTGVTGGTGGFGPVLDAIFGGNGSGTTGDFTPVIKAVTDATGYTGKDEQGRTTTTEKTSKLAGVAAGVGTAGLAVGVVAGAPWIAALSGLIAAGGVAFKGLDFLAKKMGHAGIVDVLEKAKALDQQETTKAQEDAAKAQGGAAKAQGETSKAIAVEAAKTRESSVQTNAQFLEGAKKLWDNIGGSGFFSGTAAAVNAPMPTSFHEITSPINYASLFNEAGKAKGVDPTLLAALGQAESSLNKVNISPKGALGIMQIMPSNLPGLGISDWSDPKQSIYGGADMMSSLLKKYNGNPQLATAAYNAGPKPVDEWVAEAKSTNWDDVKKFAYTETRNHVDKVMANWQQLSGDKTVGNTAQLYGSGPVSGKAPAPATALAGPRQVLDVNVNLTGVNPENESSLRVIIKQVFDQLAETQQLKTITGPYALR